LLVLGRKYKFTQIEINRVKKKFNEPKYIKYSERNPEDVLDELKQEIEKKQYKIIILNTKAKVPDEIIKYLTNLQFTHKIELISTESFMEKYLQKCYIPDDHKDLDFLSDIKPYNPFEYFLKRVTDFICVTVLLSVSLPIMFYARYRIKKDSPGTSQFKQDRVGRDNKEFRCVKFRSMRLDAEKDGAQFATENDPRIFPWGETMRKTRIDELPQMLNVLKGEMHFIGPRPERKYWTDQFEKEIPYYSERHLVAPGITGWAQVMYPYGASTEDAKQKLMYDLYYIKHWNLWLELKIVWKTIMVVLGKRGV
jgi:lipopolysaccharide/colanic/teichoic acid biosynthesis glycosyltransferase